MTTTTISSTNSNHPAPAELLGRPRVGRAGVLGGAAASIGTVAVAAIADAAGVSLKVSGAAIPLPGFAEVTFVAAMIGTLIAVVLRRRAGRPRRTFLVTTVALTALSMVPDALADAHPATKFTLVLTHLLAAAIVIPALASRLSNQSH